MFTLQVAGAIHDIKPAAEIVDEMMSGALAGATCDLRRAASSLPMHFAAIAAASAFAGGAGGGGRSRM
jgi:hypothetical protein